jgi:hypothetical protein
MGTETSEDDGSKSQQVDPLPSPESVALSTIETVEVISEQKFSIKRIIRPYFHTAEVRSTRPPSPTLSETKTSSPLFTQVSLPFKVVDKTTEVPASVEAKEEAKVEEKSVPIHLTAPEDDGVKMKWFREEMRQSPVWITFPTNADV